LSFVIPGLVPGIHDETSDPGLDCQVKPGNDKWAFTDVIGTLLPAASPLTPPRLLRQTN
jgi:hypothetical protein